jgi:hypothetical protein
MLYTWRGKNAADVETKLKAAGIDTTASLDDVKLCAVAKALELLPMTYFEIMTIDTLRFRILAHGPLKVSVKFNGKHSIVVTGVDPDKKQFGFIDPWQFDPGDGADGTAAVKERWSPFPVLEKGVKDRGLLAGGVQGWAPK